MDHPAPLQTCHLAAGHPIPLPTASLYLMDISTNPLSPGEITTLQKYHGDHIAECLICYRKYLDETEKGDPLKVHDASTTSGSIPHILCRACATRHFEEHNQCPVCRAVLFRMEDDNAEPSSDLDEVIAIVSAVNTAMIDCIAEVLSDLRDINQRRRALEERERQEFERAEREE